MKPDKTYNLLAYQHDRYRLKLIGDEINELLDKAMRNEWARTRITELQQESNELQERAALFEKPRQQA